MLPFRSEGAQETRNAQLRTFLECEFLIDNSTSETFHSKRWNLSESGSTAKSSNVEEH